MKALRLFLTLSICFIMPAMLISCSTSEGVYVSYVNDGDTFESGEVKYRLFGVDTPESFTGGNDWRPTTGIEKIYATEAANFLEKELLHHTVSTEWKSDDKYGRQVVKVNANGHDIGLGLINRGLARVAYISLESKNPFFTTDSSYYKKLLDAQRDAYFKGVGLWANSDLFKVIFPKA